MYVWQRDRTHIGQFWYWDDVYFENHSHESTCIYAIHAPHKLCLDF